MIVMWMPGEDPIIEGLDQLMFWEAQALFLRCADLAGGEE